MTEDWKQWEGQAVANAFRLQKYLGGDGEQAVFLTEHGQPAPERAAIKIVVGEQGKLDAQLSRWSLAAKLSHPNLLRIFSAGRASMDETPLVYLVMEYAGESLAQVIPVRPLSPEEARQMLDPTVDALAYLHTQGFVHGRVQPGNIMAVEDCVKMSTSDVCRAGDCLPVVRDVYTAPEGTASPAADVWSLGVTLVETLTQRPPIGGSIDPVVSATLPQPFLEIARECLRSDPKNRVSAADIAVRLHTELRLAKRPRLKWAYALAAAAGLVIAAVLIAPRLIDQREPVQKTEPAQFPEAQPVPAAPVTPPSAARNPIIQRVLPPVPARASRTIQGRVKLSVLLEVDPSGKVMNARLDPAGPSAYFAQLALQAARRWKFAPATGGDGARPRVWIVHFEFSRTGTKAVPVRKGS